MILFDKVRYKIGELKHDDFEVFCTHLMREIHKAHGFLESGINNRGQGVKGTPDAHIKLTNGNYIAFQFTTCKEGKSKIIKDIRDLGSQKCHFRDTVEKIVICTNSPVHSEVVKYEEIAASYGWTLEFFSLDRLTHFAIANKELLRFFFKIKETDIKNLENFYDCGERLKTLRVERGLSHSEFSDFNDFKSEKRYSSIEGKQTEASSSEIDRVSQFTGANIDWIKHGGTKTKYRSTSYSYYNYKDFTKKLIERNPESIFFCIEPEGVQIIVVICYSDFHWETVNFMFNFNFSQWIDDHNRISDIYKMLHFFYKCASRFRVQGREITKDVYDKLIDRTSYKGSIIRSLGFQNNPWIEDIFDLDHKNALSSSYEAYGKWFVEIQKFFLNYKEK